jgi:hypothetical protein
VWLQEHTATSGPGDQCIGGGKNPIHKYCVYQLCLSSSVALPQLGQCDRRQADLIFTGRTGMPSPRSTLIQPLYESIQHTPSGETLARFYESGQVQWLSITGVADFRLNAANGTLDGYLDSKAPRELVHQWLLGTVLAYVLEARGTRCLHASTVAIDNRAIAFLGECGGGKSTLAAAFVSQGIPLLTDDVLPLRQTSDCIMATPSYPEMRLQRDAAQFFGWDISVLPRVVPFADKVRISLNDHNGRFCPIPQPLTAIYVPTQANPDAPLSFERLSPQEALFSLIRHAFCARLLNSRLQRDQLESYAQVATSVPVYRITYPRGLHHLPTVVEALIENSPIAKTACTPHW